MTAVPDRPRPLVMAAVLLLACAMSGAAPAVADDPGRLDPRVAPTFEDVRLVLDARKPDYSGDVRIDLKVAVAVSAFKFHARDLDMRSVILTAPDGTALPLTTAVGSEGLVTATAAAPLQPGDYRLAIDFAAKFGTQATGLYRLETGGDAYLFTQFESIDARGAFPCWDEPRYKIPFRLTLVVPKEHQAVGNAPIETDTVEGGTRTVVFKTTPPLPSYLLAIATGPLEFTPIPGLRVNGRIVTVRGHAGLAAEAARITPPLVKELERYFDMPYPYEKLDLLAAPEFWPGAMENAGAITFADEILLLDPKAKTEGEVRRLVAVTAHELAHMWFGDLVTMEWWDDLWLNESFASWMGDKVSDAVFPQYRADATQVDAMQDAMQTDARLSTRAIRQPVKSGDNFDQLADALAYDKGQAVLGMFEQWLGPDVFRLGVVEYLHAHQGKNATAADLWAALSKAAGRDVGGPMSTFLDERGVPLLTCEVLAGGRLRLSQKRFVNEGIRPPRSSRWQIPVTLKYSDGIRTLAKTVLMKDAETIVDLGLAPVWVHPNVGERGYYRWSVPLPMLEALAGRGTATGSGDAVLDLREKLGFLGNIAALLDGGRLDGGDYLRLLDQFAADAEPEVGRAWLDGLEKIRATFYERVDDDFAFYLRARLRPALERLGRAPVSGESAMTSTLRARLVGMLAIEGNDPDTRAYAERLGRVYLKDPASVDPTLVDSALEALARRGNRELFDLLKTRFEKAATPSDRARFLEALGEFDDPALIDAALKYALAGPLRAQEVAQLPAAVAREPAHRQRVWEWVRGNYRAIVGRIPGFYASGLVRFAGGCSPERMRQGREFFADPAHTVPGTDDELRKVTDQVADCAGLRDREAQSVAAFFSRLRTASTTPGR